MGLFSIVFGSIPKLTITLIDSAWDGGVIYALRHPFLNTFIDVFGSHALLLVDFDVTHFFTLFSYRGGAFNQFDDSPLFLLLQRY
ncbi:hypothetical protein [Ktedonospora formicarum]|uniref:Uncharacterized protein n=1 Tax=Ktedonospora formicarum TaxID=2778364 RepID=A0A8J3MUP9_9CHLR|nr:hypothetical protein [Ktedonospora formicarum]GHO47156.1 hypothetical protein KSX_53190 [Ktedonospora formicarum]